MPQPHQTADPVHEWHLSEPRANPMMRGNLPKSLCSREKCLLRRGMQKIPGHTGSSLLAVWWYSGANKGQKWDLRCNEHLKKMVFKDLLETFLLTPSQEGERKKNPDKDEWQNFYPKCQFIAQHNLGNPQLEYSFSEISLVLLSVLVKQ